MSRSRGSSLKKYQENPSVLVGAAIQSFRSKGKKTIFVEGINDKSFLQPWINDGFRFDGFVGKEVVEGVARYFKNDRTSNKYIDSSFALADIDYDLTAEIGTVSGVKYFFITNDANHVYNDLDVFIFNSKGLKKLLSNLRIELSQNEIDDLRDKVQIASSIIGKYRAADYKMTGGNEEKTVLNGLNIIDFFDPLSLVIDDEKIRESIKNWSDSLDIEELIAEADSISRKQLAKWSLSRGHDISLMLAEHLKQRYGKHFVSPQFVEERLRIGCELSELLKTHTGQRLLEFGALPSE
ncbi:hypothetical protein [Yersinia sp. 2541 StPb PI]|uniref:hypothetical protein n=1 Tax=Yersinia sp. 2541 StPb PI TaxID=3117407 RepID=UPI003FA469CF